MQNIEIKAVYQDFDFAKSVIAKLGGDFYSSLEQKDVYFNVRNGRMKLRFLNENEGYLVHYERANESGPKSSYYEIFHAEPPDELQKLLEPALGVRAVVKKKRDVYLIDNVRVHLDEVETLGRFLEFEAVLDENQNAADEREKLGRYMQEFKISEDSLVEDSYLDLLLNR